MTLDRMRLPVRAGYELNSEKKSGEDQLRMTTVLSMVSAGISGSGDKPMSGNKFWIVLLAVKVIEDVGITSISRVIDLRNEEFC